MKSIAAKLWLGMMILVAVVLLLLWFFQIVFLNNFYIKMQVNHIKRAGADIIALLPDRGQVEERLEGLAHQNNLTIELIDQYGRTTFSSGVTAGMGMGMGMGQHSMAMMNEARDQAFQGAMAGESLALTTSHPRFNSRFILIGLPVLSEAGVSGALVLSLPLAPVAETVAILKGQLIYITLILLVATVPLAFLLARSFTKPILDISQASMAMAQGDLSVRINTDRQDEIGRLAQTVNYMGQELSKMEQVRKDLIGNVSHELRTPLSLIKGYAEAIRDISGNMPDKRDQQVQVIIEESDRLSAIVGDILRLTQTQAGNIALNKDEFLLKQTLQKVIKGYAIIAKKNDLEILQEPMAELVVKADENKIEQVLHNLLSNAINHASAGGVVTITARPRGSKVRVEVADTGPGISPQDLPLIWDRFYKGKGGKRPGTGLGLAIVKNILEAHDSAYGVESALGQGTSFWFDLERVV